MLAQSAQSVPDRLYDTYVRAEADWSAAVRQAAGDALLETGDLSAAVTHWEAALQQDPNNLTLARRTAETYIALKRWDQARTALERVASQAAGDGWARLQLGLLIAPLDAAEARRWLAAAEARGITVPAALTDALRTASDATLPLITGAALAEARFYPQAERAFMLASERDVLKADALASVGLMRGLQGLDGLAWLDAAALAEPSSSQVWLIRGLYFRAQNRLIDSLDALANALNLDPLNPELNAQVGQAYSLLGNTESAAFWWGQAALLSRQDPRYVEPYQTAVAVQNLSATLPAP